MRNILKKYKIIIIAAVLYLVFFFFKEEIFHTAVRNTLQFMIEMIQVLPPVLVISALVTVWVPSEIIKKGLGRESGIRGKMLSLIIGSVSAGPIYAAFPAVLVLFKKGASISNMVMILSAWAVVKIPMLLVETSFLGLKFMLIRLALTVPAILIIGLVTERIVKPEDIQIKMKESEQTTRDILTNLPNLNCGGCGYDNCRQFADAVFKNEKEIMDCIILKKQSDQREAANV